MFFILYFIINLYLATKQLLTVGFRQKTKTEHVEMFITFEKCAGFTFIFPALQSG